ncbi:MAG TPA: zf-HC2 domain-containing protein [Candidatus Binatia bacterium]|nr:zf-HC2 domain-containing protein [Candidatus Binatia bacterium]
MTIDAATLMAYADGELSAEERAEIERALAADPALRAQLETHQKMRVQLGGAYADILDDPVPERLLSAARGPTPQAAEVVDLSARREAKAKWSVREWGAMAASLVGGLVIGLGAMNTQAPLITVTGDGMSARGTLERALDTQLASDEADAVRIGLSFRTEDGGYCRTFELTERGTSGIACRDADGWDIPMTAAHGAQGDIRMAGASEAVLNVVATMIDGDPLDAEAEAAARDADWRVDSR